MQPSLTATHETGRVDNGDLSYNIQMAADAVGLWWQRHIWLRVNGEPCKRADNWIVSGAGRTGPHAKMHQVQA